MELVEIKKKRDKLQDDIYKLISEFIRETKVDNIQVHVTPERTVNSLGNYISTSFNIEIPIQI